MQQEAVLIVAQSGRFLAQLAFHAGYSVWVADCYGDQDTLAIAQRWLPLTDLKDKNTVLRTIVELSQNQRCLLVYGSGVEVFFPILNSLPTTITLIGNSAETIKQVKTPSRFFSLLQQLSIPYPDTQFSADGDMPGRWLCKPLCSFGGQDITELTQQLKNNDHYYQRYLDGLSGSVLFLAHAQSTHIISFNQQFQRGHSSRPFIQSGLSTPLVLSAPLQQKIKNYTNQLVAKLSLCGFNSLDFIVTADDSVFVLEINPRLSASAELIDNNLAIFNHHLAACTDQFRLAYSGIGIRSKRHLHFLFAPVDIKVPHSIDWPEHYHDLPMAGSLIKQGAPICSVFVETSLPFKESESATQRSLYSLLGLIENPSLELV